MSEAQIALGFGLLKRGLGLAFFGIDDIELALCSLQRCLRLVLGSHRLLVVRVSLFKPLDRGKSVCPERPIPVEVIRGAGDLGCGCWIPARALDHGVLQTTRCFAIGKR